MENYATIGNTLAFEKGLKGESELTGAGGIGNGGLDPLPPAPRTPLKGSHENDWSTFYSFLSCFYEFFHLRRLQYEKLRYLFQ